MQAFSQNTSGRLENTSGEHLWRTPLENTSGRLLLTLYFNVLKKEKHVDKFYKEDILNISWDLKLHSKRDSDTVNFENLLRTLFYTEYLQLMLLKIYLGQANKYIFFLLLLFFLYKEYMKHYWNKIKSLTKKLNHLGHIKWHRRCKSLTFQ